MAREDGSWRRFGRPRDGGFAVKWRHRRAGMREVKSAMSIMEETDSGRTYAMMYFYSASRGAYAVRSFRRGRWVEARGDIDNRGRYAARQVVDAVAMASGGSGRLARATRARTAMGLTSMGP